MFNVGGPEIMVVILVALMVLGPEQLPKAMRTFGNAMAEIRKLSSGFQSEMRNAMQQMDTSGPGGGSSSSTGGSITASTPAEADVTETVARNELPIPPATGAGEAGSDRPLIDPADRAAG